MSRKNTKQQLKGANKSKVIFNFTLFLLKHRLGRNLSLRRFCHGCTTIPPYAYETCFITCYDVLLHTKDASTHHLEDYNEISEVADISGGCSLEMVPAFYDDRSIRAHVHRTRELLSLSNLHASLSTSLALQNEISQNKGVNSADTLKPEVPEVDGLGYMEDISGSLGNLLSSP